MPSLSHLILTAALLLTAITAAPRVHAQDLPKPPAEGPAPLPPVPQPLPPNPKVFDITRVRNGIDVPYLVTFPPGYQPGPAYPVLIYFGDGEQDRAAVLNQLEQWEKPAGERRWVLVGIAKPVQGVASLTSIPAESWQGVLEEIGRILPAEGDGYMLAGTGKGGEAALYLAAQAPQKTRAVVSIGAGADESFMGTIAALKDTPVKFITASEDSKARTAVDRTLTTLRKAGSKWAHPCNTVGTSVKPKDAADLMFNALPSMAARHAPKWGDVEPPAHKPGMHPLPNYPELAAINQVLDDLHDAAAKADEARYFALYDEGAVFLGTDATERWTLEEFRAFAHPYFAKGKAWTYTPVKDGRFITIEGQNKDVAWFDEKLENAKLGLCRGSGVLVKVDGSWKIKQYNLTMLIPNAIAEEVAQKAREVK